MLKSFIFETVNNPGTGAFTLLGAVTGRRAYTPAFASGAKVMYTADNNAGVFESGWGVLNSGTNTLTRNVQENHLGTTALINFSGSVDVYCTPAASRTPIITDTGLLADGNGTRLVGRGALATLTGSQSIPNNAGAILSWGGVDYDDAGIWSAGSPTRLTVPAGITRVRLTANIEWANASTGIRRLTVRKNGAAIGPAGYSSTYATTAGNIVQGVAGAVVEVTAGQFFDLVAFQSSGAALNIVAVLTTASWFHMELMP